MELQRRSFLALGATAIGAVAVGLNFTDTASAAASTATQTMYLTGTDADNTVTWDFKVDAGRRSGVWGTIATPSCWEFSGYGTYNYGGTLTPGENGHYRHSFTPPSTWAGQQIFLVFEGSMTDTTVLVNGKSAGPVHQGAVYRFRYDVTTLVVLGQSNLLEVTVNKDSTNTSVNQAEREGDYWNFGGIFRPVYLQAFPQARIDRVGINARANGSFSLEVHPAGSVGAARAIAQIQQLNGTNVGSQLSAAVPAGATKVTLGSTVTAPALWSAETPNLYQVVVSLTDSKGAVLHTITQRFGFRTMEVRAGDGLYVNGTRVLLKGTCRHTFWPTLGRTSSPRIAQADILLMKSMNMNAVRMSHYPPDAFFLDLCDSLGLYVLDELSGWQQHYDTTVGTVLVQAMVTRDINHPSVLFWDNGNEGGWNTALDGVFDSWDPQKRSVLHPWATFSNVDATHYPTYATVQSKLAAGTIFMPTEFLHGLYDGGAGAGLDDYWALMQAAPHAGGGFIWALLDEGIQRDDGGGAIDTDGNRAPDGIVGPFRQKEGSYNTIRDVWSPIQLASMSYYETTFPASYNGTTKLTNHYAFVNTAECTFTWQLISYPSPGGGTGHTVNSSGTSVSPIIAPGASGVLTLGLPSNWAGSDALMVTATDPGGTQINTWVWTVKKAADYVSRIVSPVAGAPAVTGTAANGTIAMVAGTTTVRISQSTGRLSGVTRNGLPMSLSNGPALATGTSTLTGVTHEQDGAAHVVTATYSGNLKTVTWRLDSNGWLRLDYDYNLTGAHDFFGVSFDYPESRVTGVTWLGRGPYRVYKNRLRGVTTDVWTKPYNDTATGAVGWVYPEFKGYHAKLYWASLLTTEGTITMVSAQEDMFLRLFTPAVGPDPAYATTTVPGGNLSFLDAIPPIGNKFHAAKDIGPEGQQAVAAGDYARTLYFHFGA